MKFFLVILFVIPAFASAELITVALDGNSDFTSINAGITAASDGDTIVVMPGIYYENLVIVDKDLAIMSKSALNQNSICENNTVVDGGHLSNSITTVGAGEFNHNHLQLNGLTIRNGSAEDGSDDNWNPDGGGIRSKFCDLELFNCLIENNVAMRYGGGIFSSNGILTMSGTVIRYNHAGHGGGGIELCSSGFTLDEEYLCSIYLNNAPLGVSIYTYNEELADEIYYLEKSTLAVTSHHFFYSYYSPDHTLKVISQSSASEGLTGDVYVSPDGDDNNDGLSAATPFQHIYYATLLAQGSADSPVTIHLAEGIYSPLESGESRVIGLQSFQNIVGAGSEETIIDMDEDYFNMGAYNKENIGLHSLTIRNIDNKENLINRVLDFNGYRINYVPQGCYSLQDVLFSNIIGNCFMVLCTGYLEMNNVHFENITSESWAFSSSGVLAGDFRNISFSGIHPKAFIEHPLYPDLMGGWAMSFVNNSSIVQQQHFNIQNLFIEDVHDASFDLPLSTNGKGYALSVWDNITVNLSNATICGNESNYPWSGPFSVKSGATLNIYNSVIYDNEYRNFNLGSDSYTGVSYSLLEDGFEDSWIMGTPFFYGLLEGNLPVDENPQFCGVGPSLWHLHNSSPCINTGSIASLPEGFELSPIDLAGNPRIYGDEIDMGCFEWQGTECDFTWQQEDNSVTFFISSNEDVYEIGWDFEGDGVIDSYALQPVHIYPQTGVYSPGVYINEGRGGKKYRNGIIIENTPIETEEIIPAELSCHNYPNPFNPSTKIEFTLPETGETSLSIFDFKGRKVITLINAQMKVGQHSVVWNGKNEHNEEVATGVYFYKLTWRDQIISKRISLIK